MLLKQDNRRNIARDIAATIRIFKRGKIERNRSSWERGSRQVVGNQQGKEEEQCGYIQVYFIKMPTSSIFSQNS